MRRIGVWGSLLVLVATLGLTACASMSSEPAPSLYRRLGGREVTLRVDRAPTAKAKPVCEVAALSRYESGLGQKCCQRGNSPRSTCSARCSNSPKVS